MPYSALVIVSFGGPEGPNEVMDFLDSVTRGRNIPPERIREVADRYLERGGVSPLNENNRRLITELEKCLEAEGLDLKVYLGNRNSPPFIVDTLHQMSKDGKTDALTFITSPYSSYSSCRQYQENIQAARQDFEEQTGVLAPKLDRLRHFYNHPTFIQIHTDAVLKAFEALIASGQYKKPALLFTAHSLPLPMAANCDYERELVEVCDLIGDSLPKLLSSYQLVYQSISGNPAQWLGPDILDAISEVANAGADAVIVSPIGFLSDHMEVVFDLDTDAKKHCGELGLGWARAKTPQDDPMFAPMIVDLLKERMADNENHKAKRLAIGKYPIPPDSCAPNCCAPK